jgi:hypothetical protein
MIMIVLGIDQSLTLLRHFWPQELVQLNGRTTMDMKDTATLELI